jgi:hypothetical protein
MKYILLSGFAFIILGCQPDKKQQQPVEEPAVITDTTPTSQPPQVEKPVGHANERFRNVTATYTEDGKIKVEGEAQIFEANFGWVIEDGHNELQSGNQMTDAGAPEWGKFSFIIDPAKDRDNSTLHLILFESSAKDGSRQHQLMIPLK